MRLHALKRGFSLSDHGLINLNTKESVICFSEKEIFEKLELEFKLPYEREFWVIIINKNK